MITLLLIYLLVINIVAFALYYNDKCRAIKHGGGPKVKVTSTRGKGRRTPSRRDRIPEAELLLAAWAGGALGAFIAMATFHHKTRHTKFLIMVPLALLSWVIILAVVALTR